MDESINIEAKEIDKPKLYSKRVIYVFSTLFSCIFGSVLLSINLRQINKKREANYVIIFGILYTIVSIILVNIVLSLMNKTYNSSLTIIINAIGALIQENLFYKRFIIDNYPKKRFIKPLIISFCITIPLVVLLFINLINEKNDNELVKYFKSNKQTSILSSIIPEYKLFYDPLYWKIYKNEFSKITMISFSNDIAAFVVSEKTKVPYSYLKNGIIYSISNQSEHFNKLLEEERFINSNKIICVKYEATVDTNKFIYYGYFYSSEKGVIQLVTFSPEIHFSTNENEMLTFLNGLSISK
jgi:hypothetical protein